MWVIEIIFSRVFSLDRYLSENLEHFDSIISRLLRRINEFQILKLFFIHDLFHKDYLLKGFFSMKVYYVRSK
jgi:hypothetical protein